MINYCTAGLFLLLVGVTLTTAGPHNNLQHLLLFLPDEEELPAFVVPERDSKRSPREARPESFADYFRKLQLVQSELTKNASVGEDEIAEVFKRHGLATGNETEGNTTSTNTTSPDATNITTTINTTTTTINTTTTYNAEAIITEGKTNETLVNSNTTKTKGDNNTAEGLKKHSVFTRNISGDDISKDAVTDSQGLRNGSSDVSGVSTTTTKPEEMNKNILKNNNTTSGTKNKSTGFPYAGKKQITKTTESAKTGASTEGFKNDYLNTANPTTEIPNMNTTVAENVTTTVPSTTMKYRSESWWGVSRKSKYSHYKAMQAAGLLEGAMSKEKSGILNRRRRLE